MAHPLVADYSFARPDLAALRRAGYVGIIRYLSWDGSKNLTRGEVERAWDAGLWVALNWEGWGDLREFGGNPAVGAQNGRAAGTEAKRLADAMGAPASVPVFVSADYDYQPAHAPIIAAFLDAFRQASGRPVGIYGEADIIDAMLDGGHATLGWQTNATSWSNGRISNRAVLVQRWGPTDGPFAGAIDWNDLVGDASLFAWGATTSPGVHVEAQHTDRPTHPEDDMPAFTTQEIPADGLPHAVPVVPPQGGALGWGRVWASFVLATGDPNAHVTCWVVQGNGSAFSSLPGWTVNPTFNSMGRSAVELAVATQTIQITVPTTSPGPVTVLIEAGT